MANAPGVPIERLLAQREWVRALARTLVRDEAGSDDLEQQAWLEAIERPPSHAAGLRGWFATVLRRRARDAWRSENRRVRREEAAARPEGGRPTADLVAEAEAQRRVVDALLSLEEPYREVLLLRFYEDLPPSDIALRQGVPRETVKTRLRRGLALLRGRMAARSGGEWRLALIPLAGATWGPEFPGGILVKASTKVAVAAAVLAVSGLSWWVLRPTLQSPLTGEGRATISAVSRGDEPALAPTQISPGPSNAPPVRGAAVMADTPPPSLIPRDRLPIVGAVSEVPPEAGRIEIEVDARGSVSIAGRELGMAALQAHLKERADLGREKERPQASLANAVLRVDRDLPWQGAQWLMQACAGPDVRIHRIQFYAVPDTGGEEGVIPTFIPKDTGSLAAQAEPDLVEEWGGKARENPGRKEVAEIPMVVNVKVVRTVTGPPVAPRDLFPYLDRKFPDLRLSGFHGYIDAPPSTPAGDVLAVVDAMVRAGMRTVGFKGTRALKGDSLRESLAGVPAPEGSMDILVNGESIAPR